jgi:competence protein ComEA
MNTAEKRVLALVLSLFFVGTLVRFSPWDLPEIGSVPVEFRESPEQEIFLQKKEEKSIENAEVITENEKIERKIKQKTKKKPKISFPIAINTASLEVLCAIPGVGPKMAEKIISYRKTHGPLKKEADLLKISGIGKKKSKIILKSIKFD